MLQRFLALIRSLFLFHLSTYFHKNMEMGLRKKKLDQTPQESQ